LIEVEQISCREARPVDMPVDTNSSKARPSSAWSPLNFRNHPNANNAARFRPLFYAPLAKFCGFLGVGVKEAQNVAVWLCMAHR
jgi:hypothetical protein